MFDKALFQLPGFGRMMALACVFSLLRAVCVVGQAIGLASVVVAVWSGEAVAGQLGFALLFFVCFIGRQVLASVHGRLSERYARDRAEELRRALLKQIFGLGPALVQRQGTASVASAVIQGIEDVRTYIEIVIPKMAAVVVVPLILLIAVF